MRAYWQPAALVAELNEARPVKPVRLLGEDLVLFRKGDGSYGLIGRWCAHRGVDLAYGRLEECGMRCLYHGWLYDAEGRCVEQPAGARAQPLPHEDQTRLLPGAGAQRDRLRLPRRRRPAALPRLRLLHRARRVHLRLQGPVGVQLAAGRRGRDRPQPRLLPAPLPRRGPARDLRPAVRRAGRGDRQDALRAGRRELPPRHRGREHRPRPARLRRPRPRPADPPRADHEPDVPQRLRRPVRQHEGLRAVARPDRRPHPLLVHDPLRLRAADRQGDALEPAHLRGHAAGLPPGPQPRQRVGLRRRRAADADVHRAWASTSTSTTSGRSSRWGRSRTARSRNWASPTAP